MLHLFGPGGGWFQTVTQGHLLLSRSIITASGATTYTTPANCYCLFVQCIGAGGNGAAIANSTAGNIVVGSGSNGGGYAAQLIITAPGKTFSARVGAPGVNGATQFKSSDTTNQITYAEALGGANGAALANGSTEVFAGQGTTDVGTAAGSPAMGITQGQPCHRVSGTVARSGTGGVSVFGGAGLGRASQGAGGNGGQYGGGCGGGLSVNAGGSVAAASGGAALCIVWEFT